MVLTKANTICSRLLCYLFCLFPIFLSGLAVPNEYIIQTRYPIDKTRSTDSAFSSFLQQNQLSVVKEIIPNKKYYLLRGQSESDFTTIQKSIAKVPFIQTIQPNYINELLWTPNDSLYDQQDIPLSLAKIPQIWDYYTGSDQIIVGIIDSGISFAHPDLQTHIAINQLEIPDNGVDDDHNGYVDDWRGWDFVDAPSLASIAMGDFETQDNDPSDENQHGTHVAGIIAADANNQLGIAGICWKVKILPIRAGFKTRLGGGYLEDDDAASAIIYAADRGVQVLNLSWGDLNYSPIIAAACQYAYDKGVIIIASAGNTPGSQIYYPARLATTIAVGAIDNQKQLAGFSSYGEGLDIVAPGMNILSTYVSDNSWYMRLSGTSMAAPFVTGAVALLLGKEPSLNFEQVYQRLIQSAEDIGAPGYDSLYGYGLLNTYQLLGVQSDDCARISDPIDRCGISSSIPITGIAKGTNFSHYTLMYRSLSDTNSLWHDVTTNELTPIIHTVPVEDNAELAIFTLTSSLLEADVIVRLQVTDINNKSIEDTHIYHIDQNVPVLNLASVKWVKRYEGTEPKKYVSLTYDDPVTIAVTFLMGNQTDYTYLSVADTCQIIQLPNYPEQGIIKLLIRAINLAGSSRIDSLNVTSDQEYVSFYGYTPTLGDSCLVPAKGVFDYDNNGNKELIAMNYNGNSYGPVYAFENKTGNLIKKHTFAKSFFPLAVDFIDQEPLLLGSSYSNMQLYRRGLTAYPDSLIWQLDNSLTACIINQTGEIAVLRDLQTGSRIDIFRYNNGQMTLLQSIASPSETANDRFLARMCCTNLNDNDKPDLVITDQSGRLHAYEIQNDTESIQLASIQLGIQNLYCLQSFQSDNTPENEIFVAGYKQGNSASDTYWQSYYLQFTNNQFIILDSLQFAPVITSQNCVSVLDIDADAKEEIFLAIAPHVYCIDIVNQHMIPVWTSSIYNTMQIASWEEGQDTYICLNQVLQNKYCHTVFCKDHPYTGPQEPRYLTARITDSRKVNLSWFAENNSVYYIYRMEEGSIAFLDSTNTLSYTDSTVIPSHSYSYAITAINRQYTPVESRFSEWVPIEVGSTLCLDSIQATRREIALTFNEPVDTGIINNTIFYTTSYMYPIAVFTMNENRKILLRFSKDICCNDTCSVFVGGLYSQDGYPFPNGSYQFRITEDAVNPTIEKCTVIDSKHIEVFYSEAIDSTSSVSEYNYRLSCPTIDKDNSINSISYHTDRVIIELKKPLQHSNQSYWLKVQNVVDLAGNPINKNQCQCAFSLTNIRDLSYVVIYPNPLYLSDLEGVRFINLPLEKEGEIRIYTVDGELVYSQKIDTRSPNPGVICWKAENNAGKKVASGLYFYVLKLADQCKKGKIAIFR